MDAAEFKSRVFPMSRKLLHFSQQMLHDNQEAEDAVQEVILRLWKIRETLNRYNSLEALAMKITRNWCLDRIKARKPQYIEGYHLGYDRESEEASPYHQTENRDKVAFLFRILEKLPEQQRMIVQLRDIEELEYEQIAEIMELSLNVVRVNLSRARNRIREELEKYDAYGYQTNKDAARKIL